MKVLLVLLIFTGIDFGVNSSDQEESNSDTSTTTLDQTQDPQNFFPSFSPFSTPPLGHSRPFFFQQEGAYSQRPSAYQQALSEGFETPKYYNYKPSGDDFENRASVAEASDTHALLGSGNFGVISGGTFYNDKDKGSAYEGSDHYDSYYSNNGHGRPSFYVGRASNPRPQKQREQFADFKDFADINTSNPSYSHIVVVYANRNGTEVKGPEVIDVPEGILGATEASSDVPTKKVSKAKRKLAALLKEKKVKPKKSMDAKYADDAEPMLALS